MVPHRFQEVREGWCTLPLPLPPLTLPLPPLTLPLALQLQASYAPVPHIFTECNSGKCCPGQSNSGSTHSVGAGSSAVGEDRARSRGEKRPIPEEHKDEKYYERRKRNNQAAKKSRDARKFREDQIALRAMLLEQENRLLRAQLAALREEARSLLLH